MKVELKFKLVFDQGECNVINAITNYLINTDYTYADLCLPIYPEVHFIWDSAFIRKMVSALRSVSEDVVENLGVSVNKLSKVTNDLESIIVSQ